MQLWFLTGFSKAQQKIGIPSFFHPKMYSMKKQVQLVKLWTRSQARRVKLYSIESQNQVKFILWFDFHLWEPFSRNKSKKKLTTEIERYHLLWATLMKARAQDNEIVGGLFKWLSTGRSNGTRTLTNLGVSAPRQCTARECFDGGKVPPAEEFFVFCAAD
jgi:hypothetical protein